MTTNNPYLEFVPPKNSAGALDLPKDDKGRFICKMPFMPFEIRFSLPISGRMGIGMYTSNGIELCGRECTFENGEFSFEQSLPMGTCYFMLSLNKTGDKVDSLGILFELYTGLDRDEPVVQIPFNIPLI
jgi:hypothetical protein